MSSPEVASLNAQDLVWVFVHRFLSKVSQAFPGSCLVFTIWFQSAFGECHIIAPEVQCLSRQVSRAPQLLLNLQPSRCPCCIWRALPRCQPHRRFSGGVDSDATIEIFPEGIANPCSDRELPTPAAMASSRPVQWSARPAAVARTTSCATPASVVRCDPQRSPQAGGDLLGCTRRSNSRPRSGGITRSRVAE